MVSVPGEMSLTMNRLISVVGTLKINDKILEYSVRIFSPDSISEKSVIARFLSGKIIARLL